MAKNKKELLDQIKADILAQNICPDLAKTATQLVFGDGNPDAELRVVCEIRGDLLGAKRSKRHSAGPPAPFPPRNAREGPAGEGLADLHNAHLLLSRAACLPA